jgi:hypothetical protein
LAEQTLHAKGNEDPSALDIMEQMLSIRDNGDRIKEARRIAAARPDLPHSPEQQKRDARFLNLLRLNVPIAKAGRMCGMERSSYVGIAAGEGRYFRNEFKKLAEVRLEKQENRRMRADEMIGLGVATTDIVKETGFSKAHVNSLRRAAA